jgi:hypothetical protein
MSDKKLHGREKFRASVTEEMKPILEKMATDIAALEVMKNVIFDEPGARYMGKTFPPREKSLHKVLSGFNEIDASFEVLNDVPIYMKRFPPSNSAASKVRFLKYHVGSYLNENYILRERLVAYEKVITRMYKNDRRLGEMRKQVEGLEALVSSLDGIVVIRGKHVHQKRYHDDDFERLDFFESMATEDDPLLSLMGQFYPLALRDYRKKWLKTILDNNEQIRKILDAYFETLYDVVFDKNGKFIDPNSA